MNRSEQQPSGAFIGAAWAALLVGVLAYLVGLWKISDVLFHSAVSSVDETTNLGWLFSAQGS